MNTLLPPDLDTRLRDELKPGERLLWHGQPQPPRFCWEYVPHVLIGFVLAVPVGYVLPGIIMDQIKKKDNWDVFATIIVFFALGVFLLLKPWRVQRKARRTVYAITSGRAVIFSPTLFGGTTVRSFTPEELMKYTCHAPDEPKGDLKDYTRLSSSGDAKGNLVFAYKRHHFRKDGTTFTHIGFLDVPNVRGVEKILLEMRDENLRVSNP